jgi:nitrile hydratase subunit beta
MNGVHDLGGMHGFGPVIPEPHEPIFHHQWESRVLACNLAAGRIGGWNIDRSRHTRESLPPAVYLASSYYEIWLRGLERLLVNHGLVTDDELAAGRSLQPPAPDKSPLLAADVAAVLRRGGPCDRPVPNPARFAIGQQVRARNINPAGHTRLPRYVRGHVGTIELTHGGFVFPDTNADLAGEHPQWCYTVRFAGTEIWGAETDPTVSVGVDLFESYLQPAPGSTPTEIS